MGRLDDIVARNQKAMGKNTKLGRGFGLLGAVVDEVVNDPTDAPEDRKRKILAAVIVLAAIGAIVAAVVLTH